MMAEERRHHTAVSDEEIIAALVTNGTITAAAKAAGIAPRTIYDRMGYREFKAAYAAAKADIIREAVFTMQRNVSAAVETATSIMQDTENSPATRLAAAKLILNNAAKHACKLADVDAYIGEQAAPAMCGDPARW